MTRSRLLASITILAGLSVTTASHAALLTNNRSTWLANAGGPVFQTTQLGSSYQSMPTVHLTGGGSFSTTDNLSGGAPTGSVYSIPDDWSTWSGGYTGQVIFSDDSNDLTLSLSGLSAFGFEVQPFSTDQPSYSVTVTLASGETLVEPVSGLGGAQFFGFYGGEIDSLTIQSEDNAFAFGNFVSSPSTVPLPSTAALFGLAVLALAGLSGLKAGQRADRA